MLFSRRILKGKISVVFGETLIHNILISANLIHNILISANLIHNILISAQRLLGRKQVNQNNNSCCRLNYMLGMWWTLEVEGGPRRVNHAAVSVRDNYVFSFGGYCTGEEYFKLEKMDINIFVLRKLKWIQLKTPTVDDDDYEYVPYMRYGHTASAIGDKVYIFGGRNDKNGACNNLFCFDTNTFRWSTPAVTGCIPPARDGHSACVIDKKIFIFGGYEQRSECFSNEVYALDTTTMTWNHPQVTGEPAGWRDFHTATAIGQYMYIFGGRGDVLGQYHSNQEIYDNQVVVFDTETYSWHWIISNGVPPIGRRSHSAIAYGQCIYIFGGYNGLEQKHYGDMYKFDTETNIWSKINIPEIEDSPCPRRRHCCCILDEKAVLFGGTSPAPGSIVEDDYSLRDHSDLFILDLNPSLKTLCKLAVVKYELSIEYLPHLLRCELAAMVPEQCPQKPLSSSQG